MRNRNQNALPVALLALAAGCGGKPPDEKKVDEPRLVRAVAAELRQVRREITAHGYLESESQNVVTSLVAGRLLELRADEGMRVKKGELIAQVDDREAKAALDQLNGQKAARKVDQDLAQLEVEASARRVQQALFEERKAKADFDRQVQMDPDFVSPKAKEDAELAWQLAGQRLLVAEFLERKSKLEVTRIGTVIAEMDAKARELEVRLDNHRITAPFAGVVTRRHVTAGGAIGVGTALFELVDPENLVCYLQRPQAELGIVRTAREVVFSADALPGKEFIGDVDLVTPIVSRESGHFRLRFRVRPADAATLVHGMFVRARILAEAERQALMVPKPAVVHEGDIAVVLAVRGGKACRVDLDPGLELQQWVECRNVGAGGLRPGELVVVEGNDDLKDQSNVRLAQ